MSYVSANLSLIGGANGFSHWHYRSTDAMATIAAAGYFTGDAPAQMGPKDIMTVEALGMTGMYAVNSNKTGVSIERIGEPFVHDDSKVYLYNFTPQVELLAGTSRFVVSPVAGRVTRLSTIVRSAVTTGGTLTVEIATVAVAGLSNVIADAATGGTVVTDVPTDVNPLIGRVAARQAIELVGDSAFATAGDVIQIVEISPDVPTSQVYLTHYINEVDLLAGTSQFLVSPVAGQIARLTSVSSDDVTTGGSLIPEIGGVLVVGLDCVVANAGGAGDVDTDTPTSEAGATGTVVAGTVIEIDIDSTFATAGSVFIILEITPTAADDVVVVWDYIEQVDLLAGTSHWAIAPITGHITRVRTVSIIDITTGGTITIELGGVAVPGLDIVVGDAGGVGDVDTAVPSGNLIGVDANDAGQVSRNAVTKGDAIEIVGDAAFATAGTLGVMIEITPIK